MFIFTRLMFSINFKPQTLKVYFFVYISRIYTSIHIHIVCFFQNMGLKETQEFPSPEQFVRNNYGKFTHHTEPHSENSNKSWSGEGDGEASDAEAMNQLASVVGGFVQVGQCLLFNFFCISIYLLYWRKPTVCWVDLPVIFGGWYIAVKILSYHGCLWPLVI